MKRRTVLAGVGATLTSVGAGCIADDSDSAGSDGGNGGDTAGNGNDDSGTGNATDGTGKDDGIVAGSFRRQLAVTDVDDVPEGVPVEFDIAVREDTVTADDTGFLEATATNTGDEKLEVSTPFYKGASESEAGILLYSLEAADSPDRDYTPECIDDSAPTSEFVEWTMEGQGSRALPPGETRSDEIIVVDDHSDAGCLPPGQYRFEEGHVINGTEFTWGFTVVVSEGAGEGETDKLGEPETRRYDECPREVIPYDQFPEDVQAEIDAALAGRYEGDRVYLREAMDIEESFVSIDGAYYDPVVTTDGEMEVLELQQVDPKALPSPRPVSVTHSLDGERTITLEVVADDGTTLVEGTRELYPGSEVEFGRTPRVGTHDIQVTVATEDGVEDELTGSLVIDESRFDVVVAVESDGISITGAVAELGICQYDS
jgi:hypothetical protein